MSRPFRVLLIEDNEADAFMIEQALRNATDCRLKLLQDGDEAFAYIQSYAEPEIPDLVILDLNLPCRDGAEILDLLRRTPSLASVAVAVVSSSPRDVIARQASQADCYITKPNDLDEYLAIGKELLKCARRG